MLALALPPLLRALATNAILVNIVVNKAFDYNVLNETDYIKQSNDTILIHNISFDNFIFERVYIFLGPNIVDIKLISKSLEYYDNSHFFFDKTGISFEVSPYINESTEVKEYRKKMGEFCLWDKSFRVSIFKSDLYGCMIKLGSYT